MKLMEAAENYLETILILFQRNGNVRAIDIANELGYARATVSIRLQDLRKEGYITVDEDGHIFLTDDGRLIADAIFQKHNIIAQYLISIGVSETVAYEDACKIEHHISEETLECMLRHYAKINPAGAEKEC